MIVTSLCIIATNTGKLFSLPHSFCSDFTRYFRFCLAFFGVFIMSFYLSLIQFIIIPCVALLRYLFSFIGQSVYFSSQFNRRRLFSFLCPGFYFWSASIFFTAYSTYCSISIFFAFIFLKLAIISKLLALITFFHFLAQIQIALVRLLFLSQVSSTRAIAN